MHVGEATGHFGLLSAVTVAAGAAERRVDLRAENRDRNPVTGFASAGESGLVAAFALQVLVRDVRELLQPAVARILVIERLLTLTRSVQGSGEVLIPREVVHVQRDRVTPGFTGHVDGEYLCLVGGSVLHQTKHGARRISRKLLRLAVRVGPDLGPEPAYSGQRLPGHPDAVGVGECLDGQRRRRLARAGRWGLRLVIIVAPRGDQSRQTNREGQAAATPGSSPSRSHGHVR